MRKVKPFLAYVVIFSFLISTLPISDSFARAGGGRSSGFSGSRSSGQRSFSGSSAYRPSQNNFQNRAAPSGPMYPHAGSPSMPSSGMPSAAHSQSRGAGMIGSLAMGVAGGFLGGMLFKSLSGSNSGTNAAAPAVTTATTPNAEASTTAASATSTAPAPAEVQAPAPAPGAGVANKLGMIFTLLLIGGGIFMIIRFLSRKRKENTTSYNDYNNNDYNRRVPLQAADTQATTTNFDQGPFNSNMNLDEQLQLIRNNDHTFNPEQFKEHCVDQFFNIQAAWMNRDLSSVRDSLADDIYRDFDRDIQGLRNEKLINKVESIAVRNTEIVDVRQEDGKDYITLHFKANLLDYTIHEQTGDVVKGSKLNPVKFEEFWTYERNSMMYNRSAWKLSAIDQASQTL